MIARLGAEATVDKITAPLGPVSKRCWLCWKAVRGKLVEPRTALLLDLPELELSLSQPRLGLAT